MSEVKTTGAAQAPSSYLTPEVLDELARLESAATKGPWFVETVRYAHLVYGNGDGRATSVCDTDLDCPHDADLIAALRNAARALIAAARAEADLGRGPNGALADVVREAKRADKAEAERDAAVARADAAEKALRDLAPYHQGGKSPAGQIIADALGIPFPLRPPFNSGEPS